METNDVSVLPDRSLARRTKCAVFEMRAPSSNLARKICYEANRWYKPDPTARHWTNGDGIATSSSLNGLPRSKGEALKTQNWTFFVQRSRQCSSPPFRWQYRRIGDPGRGYGHGATMATALLGIGTPDASRVRFSEHPNSAQPRCRSRFTRSTLRDPMFDSPHSFAR